MKSNRSHWNLFFNYSRHGQYIQNTFNTSNKNKEYVLRRFKNTKTSGKKNLNKDVENFLENKTNGTRSTMSILINGE